MDAKLKIKVIVGSTRQGRFGEKPARWVFDELKKREDVDAELLDLRDYPMPFLDDAVSPAYQNEKYANPVVLKWAAKIKEADGFLICTPEYNHGYSPVLKNALDHLFPEWNNKAVAFVGWGSAGGARSIEQLREVAVELQMHSVRNAVHIMWGDLTKIHEHPTPVDPALFASHEKKKDVMLDELLWLAQALKTARETT